MPLFMTEALEAEFVALVQGQTHDDGTPVALPDHHTIVRLLRFRHMHVREAAEGYVKGLEQSVTHRPCFARAYACATG